MVLPEDPCSDLSILTCWEAHTSFISCSWASKTLILYCQAPIQLAQMHLRTHACVFIKIILEQWNILYYSICNIHARDAIWVSTMISHKVWVFCFGKVKQPSIIKKKCRAQQKSIKYKSAKKKKFSISLP